MDMDRILGDVTLGPLENDIGPLQGPLSGAKRSRGGAIIARRKISKTHETKTSLQHKVKDQAMTIELLKRQVEFWQTKTHGLEKTCDVLMEYVERAIAPSQPVEAEEDLQEAPQAFPAEALREVAGASGLSQALADFEFQEIE